MFTYRLWSISSNVILFNFNYLLRFPRQGRKKFIKFYSCNINPLPRFYSSTDHTISEKKVGFEEILAQRRAEADRSYLVQVYSELSCSELYDYCSQIADIKSMFHYSKNKTNHFVLIELEKDELDTVFNHCHFMDESDSLPITSNMMWFKATKIKNKNIRLCDKIPVKFSNTPVTEDQLSEWMSSAQNISDQIKILYESSKLDEVGTRLRFFTATQVEKALRGIFPNCRVLPFGSSVNGFGKIGCDLDLVLQLNSEQKKVSDSGRLIFQGKGAGSGSRISTQRQMEVLADLLHIYLPGASNVRRILQARVPIVKYMNDFTGVDCDLSLSNLSGVYMSELLYILGSLEWKLRPLVFVVKKWASAVSLTSPTPGRWITNFSLTTLVIFYFQKMNILPSIDLLVKLARPEDYRYEGDANCTFLRDINSIPSLKRPEENTDFSLEQLLKGFFEFYANFDFHTACVNVCTGNYGMKLDHSPLYIVNPLERGLNVSRNVASEEVERLKVECRNAAWIVESGGNLEMLIMNPKHKFQTLKSPPTVAGKRMVSVKDLFADNL